MLIRELRSDRPADEKIWIAIGYMCLFVLLPLIAGTVGVLLYETLKDPAQIQRDIATMDCHAK